MRKNVRTKNPEDIKDLDVPEDQYQMNIGEREIMPGWQETPRKEAAILKTRLQNDNVNMEKLRNYLELGLAHNFLIY